MRPRHGLTPIVTGNGLPTARADQRTAVENSSATSSSTPLITVGDVHSALKHWRDTRLHSSALAGLLIWQRALARCTTMTDAHREVLESAVAALGAVYPHDAHLLQLRFREGITGRRASRELHIAESTVFTQQRDAIERLATVLELQERHSRAAYRTRWERRLEDLAYTNLVGVQENLAILNDALLLPGPASVVNIHGLGGIGKSSLADRLARDMAARVAFADMAWVTARQQSFNLGGSIRHERRSMINAEGIATLIFDQLWEGEAAPVALSLDERLAMLERRLKQAAHLIIVDNLETVADTEALLPILRRLANPSRFLLTSREGLFGEAGVFHLPLRELSRQHALQLVRQEAAEQNLASLAGAPDEELLPIFDTVGGNPLAIRLVVGQLHVHTLGHVLKGLTEAQGQPVLNLYTFVFRGAWDNLGPEDRRVFLAMPLVTEQGGDLEQVVDVSGLPLDVVGDSLARLVARNLVEARGSFSHKRYAIHSLTRTFLHEIARWR